MHEIMCPFPSISMRSKHFTYYSVYTLLGFGAMSELFIVVIWRDLDVAIKPYEQRNDKGIDST